MRMCSGFSAINIRTYLEGNKDDIIGENELRNLLSDFSCPLNLNVEKFLKQQAIEFAKKNQSVTYLVFSNDDASLVGYFTLAVKPITVQGNRFSKSMQRKMLRVSEYNHESMEFHLAAYLIAQLGKNFQNGINKKISGQQLLEIAITKVKELQYMLGGMVVFLETEENDKLLEFYAEQNVFMKFDTRKGTSKKEERLIQMLRVL